MKTWWKLFTNDPEFLILFPHLRINLHTILALYVKTIHSRIIIVILRWSGWSLFLGCRCIMSYRIYTRQWQVLSLITRGRGLWECWQVGGSRHCGHVVHSLMRVMGWSPRVHMRWVGIPQWLWVGIPRGHVHRWVVWGIT